MKITVVTPTWQRHALLTTRCIPSVAAQTVPVEHVVVSDGPDPALQALLADADVVYVEVDQHHDHPTNVGGWARNRGLEVATGDLIAYLDDDNAYRPHHIAALAAALHTDPGADFAYSRMFRHGIGDIIGSTPPRHGTIDSSLIMHRRDTPNRFGRWPAPSGYSIDWELVQAWLAGGAKWVHVPDITVDYYHQRR